ncbi:DMT family transporter [Sinisalibacter aestuarii]|uniref:ABC transporter permease n=1 Tax=Sinisalibacter aestuarii TaxID=2949426 RepID=A0ABQ5LQF2_9RHOB|nr:DMT family transporter [Sinisalibacter aestuarii]GKY87237.1 ABC transporter permease [Sinisalibacter aestuarii]
MTDPQITGKSWAMLLVLGLVWGATFMVIEIALRGITPFWLAAARIGFAAALLVAVWLLRGARLFHGPARLADWATLGFIGIFSTAVPFMLLSWGQKTVTSGFAGISMTTVAIMVLPLAHFLVPGERLSAGKVGGFVIGFAGVAALIGPGAFASSGLEGETAGRLACLGAAACYAVSSVQMQRLPPVDPIGLAAVQLLLGTMVVIPMALAFEGIPPVPDSTTLSALAVLGLVPTAAATLLRVTIIRSAGSTFMSLVNYIVPVVSVIIGAVVLAEPVPGSFVMALGLVLAGMGLSQWPSLRRLLRRLG